MNSCFFADEILEPSEIIIEKDGTVKEKSKNIDPWARFFARFFDYALFIFFAAGCRYFLQGTFQLAHYDSFIPIHFFAWIPVEAFFLSFWGTTPGKFLLKIKLTSRRHVKLDYMTALKRSFNVWFRGLGMGIMVINILCLWVAYQRLQVLHITSWDREANTLVTHSSTGKWRIVLAAIVSFSGIAFFLR